MTTQARDPKIVEEFGRRRRRQITLAVLLITGVIWLTWVMEHYGSGWRLSERDRGMAVMAVVLSALAYSWRNWRCPACNRYLGKSMWLAFCPGCGVPLK